MIIAFFSHELSSNRVKCNSLTSNLTGAPSSCQSHETQSLRNIKEMKPHSHLGSVEFRQLTAHAGHHCSAVRECIAAGPWELEQFGVSGAE